jgi:hypothetical protein
LDLGGCGEGLGRAIQLPIESGEKIPCGSVFGFKLCRAFGVGKGLRVEI